MRFHTLTHWGPMLVESDGQRIVSTHPHPADPDPAVIGQGVVAMDQCRVEQPAVRSSWLDDGPGARPHDRGRDPFVNVSWDTALDLVATELARVKHEAGNEAIFAGSYGWGSAGRFHTPATQLFRFMRMFGGYTDVTGTYSASAAETIVPYIFGLGYHQAVGQQTSWRQIRDHCQLFVSFGSFRLNNSQVTFGGQGPHHTSAWVEASTTAGVEFLSISPLADDHDGSRWLPIRPGTDVALMAALIHTLIAEGLADREFLATYCSGWEKVAAYITGVDDGQPKDADWASEITEIPVPAIQALAREMSEKRTTINLALALQRADHGEQVYWMATALAAALGQIGLPGGGVAFPFGAQGNTGAGQVRKRIPGMPVPPMPDDMPVIPVSRVTEMLERPGQEYPHNGITKTFPDIRLIYWAGGNPFHHHQDLNRLERAWAKPETVVVHEPFWTPTARRADIVLPTTTPFEREDLGAGDTILVAMQQALSPLGQARDDHQIFAGLADRLAFGDHFTEGRTTRQWLQALYEQFRAAHDYCPPFEQFWEQGWLVHPDMTEMGENDTVFLGQFRFDPQAHPLPSPSGKIELYSPIIDAYGYDDCPAHPVWLEPYERLGRDDSDPSMLHLVSNQPTTKLHSQYDHAPLSQAAKVEGRERLRIHPTDADARGISDGDVVRVSNDRGQCLAGVAVTDKIRPGVVQMPTGAWYDPDPTGLCRNGNPNVLTRDKGTSSLAQGPTAHTCLVNVEPYKEALPDVEVYRSPNFRE